MPSLPFKTQMSPVAMPLHSKLQPSEVTLRAIDMPLDVWYRASLSDKVTAVSKVVGNDLNTIVFAIDKLNAANPAPPVVQYQERTVYLPNPAGEPSPSIGIANLALWLAAGAIAGGLLYWTVK